MSYRNRTTGFQKFLNRMGKFPLLTSEEEKEIMMATHHKKRTFLMELSKTEFFEKWFRENHKNNSNHLKTQLRRYRNNLLYDSSFFLEELSNTINWTNLISRNGIIKFVSIFSEYQVNPNLKKIISLREYSKMRATITEWNELTALKNMFINHNIRLVINIAKGYLTSELEIEDLTNTGVIGLTTAFFNFNPQLGFRFSTYATWWINQSISRDLSYTSNIIRLPAYLLEKLLSLKRLRAILKDDFSVNNAAMIMKLKPSEIDRILEIERMQTLIKLDEYNPNNDSLNNLAIEDIEDVGSLSIDEHFEQKELRDLFKKLMDMHLSCREKDVILRRFYGTGQTLEEIGKYYGLSRERIRQIENDAIMILKNNVFLNRYKKENPS